MLNEDTIQYAIENTQVIVAPQRRIATFGDTSFRYFLVTELMDTVGQVRVRDGRLHAERPQIITPGQIHRMLAEGFGERAEAFVEWLRERAPQLAALKYGFQFRKSDVSDNVLHGTLDEVLSRLREDVERSEDPLSAASRRALTHFPLSISILPACESPFPHRPRRRHFWHRALRHLRDVHRAEKGAAGRESPAATAAAA